MRFREEQRFGGGWRRFWAGVVLGPVALVAVAVLVGAVATGANPTWALLVLGVVGAAAFAGLNLLLRAPMVVEVTDERLRVRAPFVFTEDVPAAEIAAVEEVGRGLRVRYGAGFGKRYTGRRARYTVGNDAGVVVERTNGWRIVIGSERPGELAAAIRGLLRSPDLD